MPKVSVIVPNYNHELYLKARIDSILNQTYRDFELIILDDNSTDNSKSIIESFRGNPNLTHVIYNDVNSGSTFKQWQKGISIAKGEIIWIAESDDKCEESFLEILIPKFESGNVDIVYCQSYRLNDKDETNGTWLNWTEDLEAGQIFKSDFTLKGKDFIEKILIYKNVIPNASAALFKKSAFNNVGGVKENTKTNNDWLLWLKILSAGEVSFLSKPLNYFRYHELSVIAKVAERYNDEYLEIYNRKMRFEFQKFLLSKHQLNNVVKINKQLILKNYLGEVRFLAQKGRKLGAISLSFKMLLYIISSYKDTHSFCSYL